jgi:hypothetical protein
MLERPPTANLEALRQVTRQVLPVLADRRAGPPVLALTEPRQQRSVHQVASCEGCRAARSGCRAIQPAHDNGGCIDRPC